MQLEEDKNHRSRSMSRSCAYALGDTAKGISIKFHGILERKEQPILTKMHIIDIASTNSRRNVEDFGNEWIFTFFSGLEVVIKVERHK